MLMRSRLARSPDVPYPFQPLTGNRAHWLKLYLAYGNQSLRYIYLVSMSCRHLYVHIWRILIYGEPLIKFFFEGEPLIKLLDQITYFESFFFLGTKEGPGAHLKFVVLFGDIFEQAQRS